MHNRIACLVALLLAAAPARAVVAEQGRASLLDAAHAAAVGGQPSPVTATRPAERPTPAPAVGARPPAMPMGYPALFMGPPRGNFPVRPTPAPPAPVPAPVEAPITGASAGSPFALCRAAVAAAERELGLPAHLLAAIGRVESGRRDPDTGQVGPYAWTINAEGRGSFYPTKAAAIAAVQQLQAAGVRSIDVGCMQVNLRHHPNAFANLEEAFDPAANARYAARFLRDLQAESGDWQRAAAHYHSRTPEYANPYREKVMAAWAAEQRNPQPVPTLAAAAAPARPATATAQASLSLSNGAERAQLLPATNTGRGLDAYRAMPIAMVGRLPVAFNGPNRRL